MKTIPKDTLQEIVNRLVKEFQPEKVILFGSHAWGTPNEDSDLDLLVVVPDSHLPPVKRAIQAHRCLLGLNIPKDILVKTRSEVERMQNVYASLECQILEKGRVLYG